MIDLLKFKHLLSLGWGVGGGGGLNFTYLWKVQSEYFYT